MYRKEWLYLSFSSPPAAGSYENEVLGSLIMENQLIALLVCTVLSVTDWYSCHLTSPQEAQWKNTSQNASYAKSLYFAYRFRGCHAFRDVFLDCASCGDVRWQLYRLLGCHGSPVFNSSWIAHAVVSQHNSSSATTRGVQQQQKNAECNTIIATKASGNVH